MKKLSLLILFICLEAAVFSTSLFAASKYYSGSAGSDMILAIPEVKGINLSSDQEYFQVLLQTQLTDTIKKYSPVQVVDRQNEDIIDNEISKSEDGSYSDSDYVEFGKKVNAKYVLIAQIINTDEAYNFSARINETETNTTKYNYSDSKVTARTIKNGMAVNMAVKDLLSQIGVQLTEEGQKSINGGIDENTLKAQENLSKGINASKRGTTVEALQYYYAAAEYNVDNTEINARLNAIQTAIASGNLGDLARGEDEAYEYWKKTLSEADEYFTKNPPYVIVYSTALDRLSRTSDELKNKENTLAFQIGLVASNNSKKTINALLKGLNNSPEVVRKAINWPNYSAEKDSYNEWTDVRNCAVTVQLINDVNKVIAEKNVSLNLAGPSLTNSHVVVLSDLNDLKRVEFPHIKSEDITENITIKIKSVAWNDKPISTDNIRIVTVEELKNQNTTGKASSSSASSGKTSASRTKKSSAGKNSENQIVLSNKDARKAMNKRTALYCSADSLFDVSDFSYDLGVSLGCDHKLFGHIFYGVNAGLYYNPDSYEIDSLTLLGDVGLAWGLSPDSELYFKYSRGYALGDYMGYGADMLSRYTIGYDWCCFEIEYSFDYTDSFDNVADRISVGLVLNKSWLDN